MLRISVQWLLTVLILTTTKVVLCQDNTVVVETSYGPVQGDVLELDDGTSLMTFLGLKYARAPIGPLRWAPPVDPDRSDELFVADTLLAACPQTPSVIILTQPWWRDYDEDCLHLNVYAPLDAASGPYPVMVFMHGGGFTTGAGSQYTGHFLAAKGVVTVFPNYRLDVLGFATTGDSVVPGNYGMLDQVHSLHWVQKNIAAFGGDPTNVIIFGESAGGVSVGYLIVSPMAAGLFHGAILQSGTEMGGGLDKPEYHPEQNLQSIAVQLGCEISDNEAMVECLRGFSATDIRRASNNCSEGFECIGFGPTLDGTFMPDYPGNIRESGVYQKVPEIVGINSEDAFLFVASTIRNGTSWPEYEDFTRGMADSVVRRYATGGVSEARWQDIYQALLFHYAPFPQLHDEYDNGQAVGRMNTDNSFGYEMDLNLKLHSADVANTYQYIFSYTPWAPNLLPEYLGCPHMVELPYVFGFPMIQNNDNVRNQSGIIDLFNYTSIDIAFSDYVMTLWTNFAKDHNPTAQPVPSPIDGTPQTWAPFSRGALNYHWIENEIVETRENYRQPEYSFWECYLLYLTTGEECIFY